MAGTLSLGDGARPAGRACFVPNHLGPGIVKADCFRIRLPPGFVFGPYLVHALNSPESLRQVAERMRGATRPRMTLDILKSISVPLPSIEDQKRTAGILNEQMASVSHLRNAQMELDRELEALRDATLRDVFLSDEIRATSRKSLRSICVTNGQYGTSEKCHRANGGVPVLRMCNIVNGLIDWSDLVYANLGQSELQKYRLAAGDLLFNRTNSAELVGKTAVFDGERDAAFASYLIRFRLDTSLADPTFVATYINSRYGREFIVRHMTRAVSQVNISASTMHEMPIPVPDVARQRELAQLIKQKRQFIETARGTSFVQKQKIDSFACGATSSPLFRRALSALVFVSFGFASDACAY